MRGLLPSLPRSEREIKHFRRVCFNENRQNHEKNRQRRAKIFRDMYFNPIFFLGFLLLLIPSFAAETQTCLAVYKEGGAPAVFQSPNCPRWSLPADAPGGPPTNCQVAVLQGRRRSQEDRAVCVLDIRIPFLGRRGIKEILVGIVAVFDGHNGAEASDLASKLLVEYFSLHVYFLLDGIYSATLKKSAEKLTYGEEQDVIIQVLESAKKESWLKWGQKRSEWSSTIFDESFHLEILKESLLRTIHDIDVTFSKEALKVNLDSGSTATVVLLADGRILVANVGDSKAFLCSESSNPFLLEKGCNSKLNRRRRHEAVISPVNVYKGSKMAKYNAVGYYAKELTRDHHLARDDERNRVEAAGGYVVEWAGVLRVNGELALSRAIGDVPFKRYGVISIPEVTDWQYITENDSFLVTASDGVFEKMTTQEVCQVLWDENLRSSGKPWCVHASSHSCADSIVNNAFERGSMDNLAAVVLPLRSVGFAEAFFQDQLDISDLSSFRLQNIINQQAEYQVNNGVGTSILSSNYYQNIIAKFDRLMIEARNKTFGCFYLSENLNNDMEYIFQSPKTVKESAFSDLDHRVLEPVDSYSSGGSLDLYNDPKFCWHFGIHEGDKGQCTSPEVFKSFLGLLDSVSYNDTKSNHTKPFGHGIPDLRYKLKRRFDRGSYGEVWLAFRWNCSNEHDASHSLHSDQTYSLGSPRLNTHWYNVSPSVSPSNESCSSNSSDGDSFILKRIMVEQGSGAYLSGLREKYFGEIFLNASFSLKDTPISTSFSKEDEIHSDNMIWNDISDVGVKAFRYDFRSTHVGNFKTPKANGDEGLEHIARFVESFESESNEIWLVFHMEGLSLSKLIYTAEEVNSLNVDEMDENVRRIQVVHPSKWWHWLRTTEAGKKEMQSLIWQLLMALKSCHDRNITHRDIKPENMIICFEEVNKGKCLREAPPIGNNQYHIKLRIIDFGSAMDDFTLKHLYGSGPTSYIFFSKPLIMSNRREDVYSKRRRDKERSEQSFEYTPPEALLNASWFLGPSSVRLKYDMWSVGVFMLELILGSPHVFQISDRTRALLDQHLEGWSEPTKELACKLRSYMEMCILVPGISPHSHKRNGIKDHGGVWPASWKCSEESFSNQVKNRDPLKLGFPNIWALRLVRQLLVWHPEDRFSVDEALQHPYFDSHR